MKHLRNLTLLAGFIFSMTILASAQTEADLKQYFEGRRVEVKIEMPASKDGINIYPEKPQPLDYSRYASSLKKYGVAVREGDRLMITKVKIKDKHIEFQLGGGGYGTFGDETSSSVSVPTLSKSQREKDLEKRIKDETDERRRKRLREELDYLRRDREREDANNRAEAAVAEEIAKARIQEKRLQGGSRFNINFSRKPTASNLTPEAVMEALAEYVNFGEYR